MIESCDQVRSIDLVNAHLLVYIGVRLDQREDSHRHPRGNFEKIVDFDPITFHENIVETWGRFIG